MYRIARATFSRSAVRNAMRTPAVGRRAFAAAVPSAEDLQAKSDEEIKSLIGSGTLAIDRLEAQVRFHADFFDICGGNGRATPISSKKSKKGRRGTAVDARKRIRVAARRQIALFFPAPR